MECSKFAESVGKQKDACSPYLATPCAYYKGKKMKLGENISMILSHPLTLLIVGAFISSYLIPSFTRKWQNHQKELEIKTDLISKISENVTTFLMAIQFAEVGAQKL